MERRLAAILAGDVVGYSRLMATNESATYRDLRDALDNVVAPAVHGHGGRVFKETGDGFLATFASVNEALDAAVAIQAGFAERPLELRIGLNLGDVIEEADDVFGDGVNVAARLQQMAEPGGIYVSAQVVRGADRNRAERFERVGRRSVKNLPEAIEVYALRPRLQPSRRMASRLAPGLTRWALPAGGLAAAAIAGIAIAASGIGSTTAVPPRDAGTVVAADTADTRPAVAVLPFDNMSGDPNETYFTDGLTEDIIAGIARNRELMVIARNSTFALRDRPTDVREIGETLGARYVVEGSARRADDRLRVVAQLIDSDSGVHLWSKSYDRRVEDVFAVQAELTAEIVASLVSYVRASEVEAAAERPTENLRAYDLVLRARGRYRHGSKDGRALAEARALYTRAIELDPDYAAAHARLGLTYVVDRLDDVTGTATDRDLETGLAAARESIRLAPDLALGYQVLGFGLAVSGDYEAGMRAAERAVELDPNDPDSLMTLAKAQLHFGAYKEAVANAALARRLHPMAPEYYPYVHGQALYAAGRPEEADAVLAECLIRAPREPECLKIRAAVLARLGRHDDAGALMADLIRAEPGFSLAAERRTRRFGESPLMERYLSDLAAAQAPRPAGDARVGTGRKASL